MLILCELYLFAMQNGNYCDFCLAVNGFYITFASEYIFYVTSVPLKRDDCQISY